MQTFSARARGKKLRTCTETRSFHVGTALRACTSTWVQLYQLESCTRQPDNRLNRSSQVHINTACVEEVYGMPVKLGHREARGDYFQIIEHTRHERQGLLVNGYTTCPQLGNLRTYAHAELPTSHPGRNTTLGRQRIRRHSCCTSIILVKGSYEHY